MKRLRDHKHMLHVLKNCDSKIRKLILKHAHPELIKTLCEICMNVLRGNAKISTKCKQKLKNYKNPLRKIVSCRVGLNSKKKILVQQGGFLPVLLGSILSGVLGNIIERL